MEELYVHLMNIDPSIVVDVICYNTDGARVTERYRGLNIHRVSCIQLLPGQFAIPNYLSLILTVLKLSLNHSYQIIHSNTRFFDHSWWVPLLAKVLKAKSVLTDHCASHPVHISKLITGVAKLIDKHLSPVIMRFYDVITVTNDTTGRFIKTLASVNPSLIYGGVDTNFFFPIKKVKSRIIPKVNIKISDKEVVITFLGRMIETKGVKVLLEVAKKLTRKFPNTRFIFAGDGVMYQKLRRLNYKKIYFTGALDRNNVAQLLVNSDIVVHPSIHHEGFPNVILEAGASGCAVIATNVGGTKELIEHNKTGIICKANAPDLESNLISLLRDKQKRIKFGIALREKIEDQYFWDKIVVTFKDMLYQIVSSSSRIHNPFLVLKT